MATKTKKPKNPLAGLPLTIADAATMMEFTGASGAAGNPVGTTVAELREKMPGHCEGHGHDVIPKSSYSITHGSVSGWGCKNCKQRWRSLKVVAVETGRWRKQTHWELQLTDPFTDRY